MTTREELVADFERAWRERPFRHVDESQKDIAFSWWNAGRLAARQEVSVEELGQAISDTRYDRALSSREMARALLAEYSITKREGVRR